MFGFAVYPECLPLHKMADIKSFAYVVRTRQTLVLFFLFNPEELSNVFHKSCMQRNNANTPSDIRYYQNLLIYRSETTEICWQLLQRSTLAAVRSFGEARDVKLCSNALASITRNYTSLDGSIYTFCCSLPENIVSLKPTSNTLTQKYIHFIQSTFTSVDRQPFASKGIL